MADRETIAAKLTVALVGATTQNAKASALTDDAELRVRLARQAVVLYETILGMLPALKGSP